MKGEMSVGLDMYVYHVEKITKEEELNLIGLAARDVPNQYHCIDKDTFDFDPEMYGDLIPYIREIPIINTLFNHEACFSERSIQEDDQVCGSFHAPDKVCWFFSSGAKVELDHSEYEKYLYEKETLMYVFKSREVAYWRKNYDLDDFIQNARIICRTKKFINENGKVPADAEIKSWQTENCGYYMLSPEEKGLLRQYLADREDEGEDYGHYDFGWPDLLNDEESALMYHAWW